MLVIAVDNVNLGIRQPTNDVHRYFIAKFHSAIWFTFMRTKSVFFNFPEREPTKHESVSTHKSSATFGLCILTCPATISLVGSPPPPSDPPTSLLLDDKAIRAQQLIMSRQSKSCYSGRSEHWETHQVGDRYYQSMCYGLCRFLLYSQPIYG